jgi:hypothetical protein
MCRFIGMVGRRVNGVKFQLVDLRIIDHVMVCACWNHNRIPNSSQGIFISIENKYGLALLDAENWSTLGCTL